MSRLASWSGNAPDPAQTPHEFAASLRERVAGMDDVELLADAYVREQFARDAGEPSSRLNETWQNVRNALVRKLLRLK